jgi:hypothetical protein
MKLMKKKMIGLLICMLFIATIPMAAGMEISDDDDTTGTTALKKTFMWGMIINPTITSRTITFRAIWVHFRVFGGGYTGKIVGKRVIVENQGIFKLNPPFIIGLFDGEPLIR